MNPAEYERLTVTLQQVISDNPPDNQIVRHAKGLLAALYGWMAKVGRTAQPVQARNGSPRADERHASVTATLASRQEHRDGQGTRT